MKLASFCLSMCVALVLVSCSGTAEKTAQTTNPVPVKELTENDIFAGDVVKLMLTQNLPGATEANKLFMEAIDLYKNKQDARGAIALFVQSICKKPDSRSYYEMGNACLETGDIDRSIQCFEMAEKLGYEPFSKVLYNLACAYSQKEKLDESAMYLEASLQAGYSNLDHIAKDEDLKKLRDEDPWAYDQAVKRGMKGMSNAKTLFWLQFRKPFAKVSFPFVLDGEKRKYTEDDRIAFDFEKYVSEMRNDRFSREVGAVFYAATEVYVTDKFIALIYAEENPFMEEGTSPILYRLVTYTLEGKLIDKQVVAGLDVYAGPLKTAKFSKDRTIEVRTFDIAYEKDPEEHGYENNKIKSRTEAGDVTIWRVDENGMIVGTEDA
jgi:tetratricopeptide (TPR) repeat protein